MPVIRVDPKVEAVQWTRQQQTNTLAAIEIVGELLAGGDKHGPIDAMLGVSNVYPRPMS